MAIPVSGIPINVTRTYDSLDASRRDEFGYGWRLEFRDTDLRTNAAVIGYTWFQQTALGVRGRIVPGSTQLALTYIAGFNLGYFAALRIRNVI